MLIKGSELNDSQRKQVLAAFVHRNTVEHPFLKAGGLRNYTDAQYIAEHAFYFVKDGSRLTFTHRYCEPHYLAK
jgi:hypothetical protein